MPRGTKSAINTQKLLIAISSNNKIGQLFQDVAHYHLAEISIIEHYFRSIIRLL
jgi:DNA integrity scanning protein DisA with diadenylate cyclase activity